MTIVAEEISGGERRGTITKCNVIKLAVSWLFLAILWDHKFFPSCCFRTGASAAGVFCEAIYLSSLL